MGILLAVLSLSVLASSETPAPAVLFLNVRVFDGESGKLAGPTNVVVRGNIIERISSEPIAAEPSFTVIDGNGRTLMPGQAAENWGTYVSVHAYTPPPIQRAIAAGVKVIEHGHLMDEATAELMAEKGIWLSFQPFTDNEAAPPVAPANRARLMQVFAGTENTIALAKKYKLKMAFGTDLLFSPAAAAMQGAELVKMRKWYSAPELLVMATGTNAQLLKLSGPRDPYPGKLGVVKEGALADLLLVDGDPIANMELIADPAKNLLVIMKDGKIYKNLLRSEKAL